MTADRTRDRASIAQFVEAVETTQWRRDAEAFLALFRPDAVWTNPLGRRLTGIEEIAAFTRQGLAATPSDVFATYEVEHIQFLSDDVAAVNVRSRPVRADRSPVVEGSDGAKLYVLVRKGGGWKFAVGHNILVVNQAIEEQRRDFEQAETGTRKQGHTPIP
jgi:uncharacterized protein (TIGR02246 family)